MHLKMQFKHVKTQMLISAGKGRKRERKKERKNVEFPNMVVPFMKLKDGPGSVIVSNTLCLAVHIS